jgi:hypothetical protein
MLNRIDGRQELYIVNMLIQAISDEMAQQQTDNEASTSPDTIPAEIEEALYELRLRKLLISAMIDSDQDGAKPCFVERRRTKRTVM